MQNENIKSNGTRQLCALMSKKLDIFSIFLPAMIKQSLGARLPFKTFGKELGLCHY